MIEALDKLLSFLLIVILLFVLPVFHLYQRQDDINYHYVVVETQKTADLICEVGYVDKVALRKLEAALAATGTTYEVELIHLEKKFVNNQETKAYYEATYRQAIDEEISQNGYYSMGLGDFFYISVENSSETTYQRLRSFVGLSGGNHQMMTKSGGLVRYEQP